LTPPYPIRSPLSTAARVASLHDADDGLQGLQDTPRRRHLSRFASSAAAAVR
jgi:hypothetical protein